MSEGFQLGAAYSVFEGLRAEPGEALDRVAIATYSLDLVAFAALMLSLSKAGEEELDAGPLRLLEALDTIAPRIDVVYQKDRLRVPTRHHQLLHLLDGRLHAIQPPAGTSYHPKLALARYLAKDGEPSWRLWIGSRNMTAGEDREAGVLLCGSLRGRRGSSSPEIATMAGELLAPVRWVRERAAELARTRWRAPAGTRLLSVQWRREGEHKPFDLRMPRTVRTLAVSPFVDKRGCALGFSDAGEGRLLTIAPEADKLGALDGVEVRVAGTPTLDLDYDLDVRTESAAETPETPGGQGLHAKLIVRESRSRARLWLGSANLTRRGLEGQNAEVVAALDVPLETARILHDLAAFSPIASFQELDPAARATRLAEQALDEAISVLLNARLVLGSTTEGLILSSEAQLDPLLARYRVQCWLLTRPGEAVEWLLGTASVVLTPSLPPARLQTLLVCFSVEPIDRSCKARSWAQLVDFPEFDAAARDLAAKAAYARMAGASAWLRGQLEGMLPAESVSWSAAEGRAGSMLLRQATLGEPLVMEEVLAAWARNPDIFESRVERIDTMLAALGLEIAASEDDDVTGREEWTRVEKLWREVRASLEIA